MAQNQEARGCVAGLLHAIAGLLSFFFDLALGLIRLTYDILFAGFKVSQIRNKSGFVLFWTTATLFCCVGVLLAGGTRSGDNELSATPIVVTVEVTRLAHVEVTRPVEPTATGTPTTTPSPSGTPVPTATFTPTIIGSPTATATPKPAALTIPYHACGEGVGLSVKTTLQKISLIENDKVVDYGRLLIIKYSIKNTYDYTPIYGFEVQIDSAGYGPENYPSQSPFYIYDPLISAGTTIVLQSAHLFVPDAWIQTHPNFGISISGPFPSKIYAILGREVTFTIVRLYSIVDDYKKEMLCEGAIRLPEEK